MQSTTKKPLTKELVARALENLEAIPPAPEEMLVVSVTAAIQILMPALQKLVKKGYKRPKIVEFLREQGIECSEATLKTLYRAPKSRKAQTGKGGEGSPSSGEPARSESRPPIATLTPEALNRSTGTAAGSDRKPSPATGASNLASVAAKAS
jgi:hypothetical protein